MLWNIRPHLSSWILAISAIGWGNPKSFDFVGYWSRPRKAIDCPQHDWCKVFSSIGLTSQFYMGNTFLVQRQFGCCQLASMFGVLASVQCVFAWCLLSYSERPSKTWLWFEFTLHILGAFWMVCSRGWSKSWTPRRMARCLSKNSWHGGERTSWRPPMFERCKTKPEQFGLWTQEISKKMHRDGPRRQNATLIFVTCLSCARVFHIGFRHAVSWQPVQKRGRASSQMSDTQEQNW